MAAEMSAGAVLVELKAQYQDLKKNVTAAKAEMTGFGASVDATAKRVSSSGQQISNSFDSMDKKSVQLVAKMARLSGAMFAAQGAFQSLSGDGQNKGISAASTALSTFAAISLAMPHPVGLAIAAVAGLTTGILKFLETAPKGTEAAKEFGEALKKSMDAKRELELNLAFTGRTQTGTQRDLSILALQRGEQEDVIRKALSEQATLRANRDTMNPDLFDQNFNDEEERIKLARAKLRDIMLSEGVKDRQALAEQNKLLLDATAIQLQAGLISPLDAIQVEAQAARRELDALLKDPKTDPTALGLAIDKAKSTQGKVDAQKNLENLAQGFSTAFGSAIERGILSGEAPMKILANVGESLFSNMIGNAIKQLQDGLASALSGLGEIGAGAISGILGIGGAVLSRLGGKSTSTFGSVQNVINSSQEVRGIIAGPTSIATAQVGENIRRAMVPVVERLDISNQLLNFIERNTRPRRGGSGGSGDVDGVSVPTDLT